MRLLKSISLLMLIFFTSTFAQNQWVVYKYPNLPDNRVYKIVFDAVGNKWIGTYDGLCRLTGSTWTIYNTSNSGLPNNTIYSLALDGNGNKWIGTNGGGLALFTGTAGWTIYNTSNSGLPNNNIRYSIVLDNNGNKWIGTLGGLTKFDGQNWTTYNSGNSSLPYNEIRDMTVDQNNILWIATSDGMARFNGSQAWTIFKPDNPISSTGLPHNNIMSIAIAPNGVKWIGTSGGLVRFDDVAMTTYKTTNSNIPSNSITSVAVESNSVIWVGTDQFGIAKFNGTTFTTFNTSNSSLPSNTVHFIKIDASGNKWIGTYAGLALFNESGIVSVEGKDDFIPSDYSLFQNYPNPFNPSTLISYRIAEPSNVTLEVFDLLGKKVASLVNEFKLAGTHQFNFSTNDLHQELSSGIYFYQLRTGNFVETKKMILMR
jgi:ligand-binding sensor domain-containing protein